MKYYSEVIVNKILSEHLESSVIPDLSSYSNIEIEEPHGPLADLNKIKDTFDHAVRLCEVTHKPERADYWRDARALIDESAIILEATWKHLS